MNPYNMTNKQFKALPRNTEGDLIDVTPLYFDMPDTQYAMLTSDDCSRYEDCHEEMRCLVADAINDFSS